MKRKLVALVLCALVFVTVLPAQGLPESAVAKQLPKAEDMVIDPINYHRQLIQGYYDFAVYMTEDVTRPAKFYIPVASGTGLNRPTIFVMIPDGVEPYQFLVDSGWKAVADTDEVNIVLGEPGIGGWKTLAEDMQYLHFLRTDVNNKPFFSTYTASFYAVAYGEKATAILQEYSILNPTNWSGVVLAGTTGVREELVAKMKNTPSSLPGSTNAQVPLPMWIVSNEKTPDVKRLVEYQKQANHSEYVSTNTSYADELYVPRKGGNDDHHWCSNVVYSQDAWANCVNVEFASAAYHNLFKGVLRYSGALRKNDDIYARGVKKFTALVPGGFKEDGSDKYTREWVVHVPKSVDTSKPAPLVFVYPGAGGVGETMLDRSGWATVADDKGFIVVSPTASHINRVNNARFIQTPEILKVWWNTENIATETRPNDLLFVSYLYDWMRANYNIDESRVYVSGQSSGGMMTWATLMYLPEIFTAGAPVSAAGSMGAMNNDRDHSKVGIISFLGEKDIWPGAFGGDGAKATATYWTNILNTVEDWSDYTYLHGGQQGSYTSDEFTNYVFHSQNGTPVMRLVEVADKGHQILPSECYIAWNECFSRFTKDKTNGNLYYNGVLVE